MNVAVRRVQHSERLGHFALSQTVSSPSSPIRFRVKDIPATAGIGRLSHSGSRRAVARPLGDFSVGPVSLSAGAGTATRSPRTGKLGKRDRLAGTGSVDMGADLPANQRVVGINMVTL